MLYLLPLEVIISILLYPQKSTGNNNTSRNDNDNDNDNTEYLILTNTTPSSRRSGLDFNRFRVALYHL